MVSRQAKIIKALKQRLRISPASRWCQFVFSLSLWLLKPSSTAPIDRCQASHKYFWPPVTSCDVMRKCDAIIFQSLVWSARLQVHDDCIRSCVYGRNTLKQRVCSQCLVTLANALTQVFPVFALWSGQASPSSRDLFLQHVTTRLPCSEVQMSATLQSDAGACVHD